MDSDINKKIAAKLVKVMEECSHVLKRGTNDFHHYHYATSADVMEKVNASLVANKLCALVKSELLNFENVTNAKGNMEHLATVRVNVTLIDADSGEKVEISGMGNGQDIADKAIMKAETAAIKYAYMLSFAISTGDDPEADTKTDDNMNVSDYLSETFSADSDSYGKVVSIPQGAVCTNCGTKISAKVKGFSEKRYGRGLCMNCQQIA